MEVSDFPRPPRPLAKADLRTDEAVGIMKWPPKSHEKILSTKIPGVRADAREHLLLQAISSGRRRLERLPHRKSDLSS